MAVCKLSGDVKVENKPKKCTEINPNFVTAEQSEFEHILCILSS